MPHETTKLDSGLAGKHLVRYGTPADQLHLVGPYLAHYDQLVFNANIVAHAPAAITSFVIQRAKNKPFLIDPQTHAFQHGVSYLQSDPEVRDGQIKKSVATLAKQFGSTVKRCILTNHRSVRPNDFGSPTALRELVEGVLEFQGNQLEHSKGKSEVAKYFAFLKKKGLIEETTTTPTVFIAPYFFVGGSNFEEWLELNVRAAKLAQKSLARRDRRLAVQVCIDKALLDNPKALQLIASKYSRLEGVAAFLTWFDGFDEHAEDEHRLISMARLLRELGATADVVNLYGSYFSVALCRLKLVKRLRAVCHGLEYGESRRVVPVGGGVPLAKFYFRPLYKRLAPADAVRAVRLAGGFASAAGFHEKVCGCRQCLDVITKKPELEFTAYTEQTESRQIRKGRVIVRAYSTQAAKLASVRHYLWCRAIEYSAPLSFESLEARLLFAKKNFLEPLGQDVAGHCTRWMSALRVLRNQNG